MRPSPGPRVREPGRREKTYFFMFAIIPEKIASRLLYSSVQSFAERYFEVQTWNSMKSWNSFVSIADLMACATFSFTSSGVPFVVKMPEECLMRVFSRPNS